MVVKRPEDWPLSIPGLEIVSSKDYLVNPRFAKISRAHIFNLCRSYRYQSNGYYVSLLAEARGHRALPSVSALQDMRSTTISRIVTEELDALIQRKLKDIQSTEFNLSIYFGKNLADKYDRLALKLYNMFEAPLLRAFFIFKKEWVLKKIVPISASEIPDNHREFVLKSAQDYFKKKRIPIKKLKTYKYDLAILYDPEEKNPPSDSVALKKFEKAAEKTGIHPELITRDDYARIAEYDALFIRTTTQVNHYTYQFSRRAQAETLVVIDDPESIIRCTNKIYLAEVLSRAKVPTPKTQIIHKDNLSTVLGSIPLPCIIKLPDSAFSLGVKKAQDTEEFTRLAEEFFEKSDLILVQEFIPTDYDWRIGILDGKLLYACKYHMAHKHWQILKHSSKGQTTAGNVQAVPLNRVPDFVKQTALNAANLIGNGFYGVDLKELPGGQASIIEVNDNPSIDAGYEDQLLKDKLYEKIMGSFFKRLNRAKERN